MRITIVGLPGSGKTRLAEQLSKKYGIPHIHLDRFWFESGGPALTHGTSPDELARIRSRVREKVLGAIASDEWVSDGFYSRMQPDIAERAEIILFLDVPLWRRLLNHAIRIFTTDRHSELTFWDELRFFPEIVRRDARHGPKIRQFISENRAKVTTLKSHKEINDYMTKDTLRSH